MRGLQRCKIYTNLSIAEDERFELPVRCRTTVFKTDAIDHSANPPFSKQYLATVLTWLVHMKEIKTKQDFLVAPVGLEPTTLRL